MAVDFFKEMGVKEPPSRLFVGGIHGKEGESTIHAIMSAENLHLSGGSLVLSNFSPSPYLSTLNPLYYMSLAGGKLLDLIRKYQPQIYLELHCYHPDKKLKLTGKNRKELFGVPSLVELENGVLIGSTSPLIRSVFFDLYDFPFILEIPCQPSPESLEVAKKMMEIASKSNNRSQIMEKLSQVYPLQVKILSDYFKEYSTNFYPAFFELKKKVQLRDLKNYRDLEELVNEVVSRGSFNLNPAQIKQLTQAYLIFREHG
ncbi:MAG: DUF2119 domain-containing protein [Methanobacteriaceae archaeon]|nr:DUF2119 domain-containing protein [Methanobacteriaceae archaeon]